MTTLQAVPEGGAAHVARPTVELGLIISPRLAPGVARGLEYELADELRRRYPDVEWRLEVVRERLVTPPVQLTNLVEATRDRLLAEGWELAVLITGIPLRLGRRPLLTHASPTHAVAVVSLPAVGVVHRGRRLRDAVADAVGTLVGDPPGGRDDTLSRRVRVQRRLSELAEQIDDPSSQGVVFLARVISGNVRLLLGMIRANQPWRLLGHLSRALIGALAPAAFALVTSDVWRISASLDVWKLAALALGALGAAVVTVIASHDLWERAPQPEAREQVLLFNLATLATVAIGIASLYGTVFASSLVGAWLLIDPSLFEQEVGKAVGAGAYVQLGLLASTLATVGGALGATLETDVAVREAAYAYRPEEEVEA